MTTPGRTILRLMARISAGETVGPAELRAAAEQSVPAIISILDQWTERGFLTRIAGAGQPRYAITPLGEATERWD